MENPLEQIRTIVRKANHLIEMNGPKHEFSKGAISMAKIAAESFNIDLALNEPGHYWYFTIPNKL